ncbi:hypothetical protein CGLO_10866 [Colletotrichum gloeosporioides Cg-14]|uniref:Uncharacterized protein n=1 Tax=Colletotrichum gloeosporioides (strain Cg-14) TaxID=1237896 RepID=T0LDF6_COLGC|nr:hypothetical protein CGLO_10866 [Colletotrichum gloeosporioides Cg-14]
MCFYTFYIHKEYQALHKLSTK